MCILLCLDADTTRKCAPRLEDSFTECQTQAGGKNHVVLLKAGEGVAQVAIAVGDLPTEPVFQLGGGGGVELEAVTARVRDVREQAKLFCERGAIVDLGVEGFAEVDFAVLASNGRLGGSGCGSGDGSEVILVVVAASK